MRINCRMFGGSKGKPEEGNYKDTDKVEGITGLTLFKCLLSVAVQTKESTCHAGDPGIEPGVWEDPWREWVHSSILAGSPWTV